jgi:probable HAF family extracellular repeat protein
MTRIIKRVFRITPLLFALSVIALAATPATALGERWTLIDYGVVCGQSTHATDINNLGQVSGWCYSYDQPGYQAFVWTFENGLIDLGSGQANAINEKGQVVGGNVHAFLWTATEGMLDLGTLGGESLAHDINNLGQVVGYSRTTSGEYHAFLWSAELGMIDLGTLGGDESQARGINDRGQVIGISRITTGEWRAFLWTRKSGMLNLGSFGGETFALDINNKGVVVGYSVDGSGTPLPYRWTKAGGMESLTSPGNNPYGIARGINDSGKIVGSGYPYPPPPSETHAFLWSEKDGMLDLGSQYNFATQARKINSKDMIIGSAYVSLTEEHFVLWERQR